MATFKVYTKWIAAKLRRKGFKMLAVGVNDNHPELDVYIFEDTPQFREAFQQIVKEGRYTNNEQ